MHNCSCDLCAELGENSHARNVAMLKKSGEKNVYFFCFRCATQNTALDMIKLVLKYVFFHKRIDGENFQDLISALIPRRFR